MPGTGYLYLYSDCERVLSHWSPSTKKCPIGKKKGRKGLFKTAGKVLLHDAVRTFEILSW